MKRIKVPTPELLKAISNWPQGDNYLEDFLSFDGENFEFDDLTNSWLGTPEVLNRIKLLGSSHHKTVIAMWKIKHGKG